jgi:hypothetical protein
MAGVTTSQKAIDGFWVISVNSRQAMNRAASCLRKSEVRSRRRLSAKYCRIGPKHERNFCVRFGRPA